MACEHRVSLQKIGPSALEGSVGNQRIPRMPPDRRLNLFERASLIREILNSYLRARRVLRETSIEPAVATLRQQASPNAQRKVSIGPAVRTLSWSAQPDDDEQPDAETLIEARRLARAVRLTLTMLPGDKRCLVRSLVLTQLLARRTISAKLVIGARPAPSFLAHAWVEHAGHPVLPVGDGSFGRLVEL